MASQTQFGTLKVMDYALYQPRSANLILARSALPRKREARGIDIDVYLSDFKPMKHTPRVATSAL